MKYARYIQGVDVTPFTRCKIGDNLNSRSNQGIWSIYNDIATHFKYVLNLGLKPNTIVCIYELDDNFIVQKEHQFLLNEIKELMIFS